MRSLKWFLMVLVVLFVFSFMAQAFESKWSATGATAVTNLFGPSDGSFMVKSLYVKSDKAGSVVKFYARGGAGRANITTVSTSGAQVVSFSNPSAAFTTNDTVVYVHSDGTLLYTTVAGSETTGSVALTTGITKAGTLNDRLYEVTEQMELPVGASSALNPSAGWIFATPSDSPLYTVVDCSTSAVNAATTDR